MSGSKTAASRRTDHLYQELLRRSREQSLLASCAELLSWDEETYMPRGGVVHRGNQLALLAGMHHERATDPRWGELLAELEESPLVKDPLSPAAVNIRELRRQYCRRSRLPRTLVEELVRTTALAHEEWTSAYHHADYHRFQPWLERIVALKRAEAEAIGHDGTPYDALLEEYEPGARSQSIAQLLEALRQELVPLLGEITAARRQPNLGILRREFALERQRILGEAVATELGFDFLRGRLDTALHPFCASIGPGDCRIATRYSIENLSQGLFAILHEVGHALYEQGLDPAHHGTPMGEPASLGLHESQSRLWENLVGRSRPFWVHFFPLARDIFHDALHDVSLDEFYFAINHVAPSLNRALADEVTYNLHIVIRFELERALVANDLRARDLPDAWNASYKRHLGVTPPNDREGCLQDGHWSAGMFGYFPTYALGNIFSTQLFARAAAEIGNLDLQFGKGEFHALLAWLRDKVCRHGQRHRAASLVEQVTGAPATHQPLVAMLRRKYEELYEL